MSPSRTCRRHRRAKARQDAADLLAHNVVNVTSEEDVSDCQISIEEITEMVPSEEERNIYDLNTLNKKLILSLVMRESKLIMPLKLRERKSY